MGEMIDIILAAVVVLVIVTAIYRVLPHRELGDKKPSLAFFPKYQNQVPHPGSDDETEQIMSSLGFKKRRSLGGVTEYSRGSVIGDLSIQLSKVKVVFHPISNGMLPYTVEAAWVAAFDTGDHWQFTKELGDKLKSE
ncbi:hypothetical protein [Halovibrio salipaludis]|nr:hypothetical protein [Halovibrio salipaludis]